MNSPDLPASEPAHRGALWALMFGNFVIGAGVLAPAGLINQLSAAFAIDIAQVGTLIAYGAAVLCVEAPLLAFLTNRIDRRKLLAGSLLLFAGGHLVSAFAPSFAVLLMTRLVMVASAALFTPQAASAIGLFIAPQRRSSAIAFIFLGWSVSSAIAIPVVSLLGAHAGWSVAYLIIGVSCTAAAAAVFLTLPPGLTAPPLSVAAWRKVVSSPIVALLLVVTAISLTGQFVEYPFIAAELKSRLNAGPALIAGMLAVYGVAGVLGAILSASLIGRLGAPMTASVFLVAILAGLALWSSGRHFMIVTVLGLFVWGSGVGPANSAQQARLITADPALASASVALNTSAIYVGQAIGTSLGGTLLTNGYSSSIGVVGVALLAAALLCSLIVRWRYSA